jgi:hypothetical protein
MVGNPLEIDFWLKVFLIPPHPIVSYGCLREHLKKRLTKPESCSKNGNKDNWTG